jgi:hypothetical protein
LVEGEQFEDEEDFVPIAIGLGGEGLDLVVDAFQDGA